MADQPFPSIAFLWPALAAASTSGMMSALLRPLGGAAEATQSPCAKWATENRVVLELPCMHLREFYADDWPFPTLVCAAGRSRFKHS
jgi:hypothetical protein